MSDAPPSILEQIRDELAALREGTAELRSAIGDLRTDLAVKSERAEALRERVDRIEVQQTQHGTRLDEHDRDRAMAKGALAVASTTGPAGLAAALWQLLSGGN